MATYYHLYVRPAKLNNPDAVEYILRDYFCTVRFAVDRNVPAGPTLTGLPWDYSMCEQCDFDWPEAVKMALVDVVDFPNEDPDDDVLLRVVLQNYGAQGFIEMLGAIGPYLDSPLTVQAVLVRQSGPSFVFAYSSGKPMRATEWHVAPGRQEVEVNEFRHADDAQGRIREASYTASTAAEVDDRSAVERVLADYLCNFSTKFRVRQVNGAAVLSIRGKSWPLALNLDK